MWHRAPEFSELSDEDKRKTVLRILKELTAARTALSEARDLLAALTVNEPVYSKYNDLAKERCWYCGKSREVNTLVYVKIDHDERCPHARARAWLEAHKSGTGDAP